MAGAATGRRLGAARTVTPPTDVQPHEIERALKRGALWAVGSQVALQTIRLLGVIVLARLLTPDEYGAAALAVTIASFSMILGDLGYGTALVQAATASQRWASTACWCALAAGAIGAALVALGAYPAALAVGDPEVTVLVIAGGLTLLLVAMGSASNALLTRSMSFGVIQGTGVAAALVATVGAVTAAAFGMGAWALVLQQVILAAVTSILFILAARWRPSFEFSTRAFRSMSTFALPLTTGSVLFAVQSILTVLLVGHFLGVAELGIWNFAMAIVILPATLLAAPISRVIYAAFARMREDQERVAEVWVTGFTLLAGVVLPALFGLIAVAPDVIPLAFGSQWTPAVAVVQILAVFVMSRALQTWNTSVMDAAGRPHVAMVLNGLVLVALPPCIWFGSSYGIEGVAVGFAAASLVFGEFPSFYLTTRQLSLRPLNVLGRLRGIGLACAVLCVGVILIRHALEQAGIEAEPRLGLSILLGAAIYTICLWLFAPRVARDLLRMAKRLGRRRT